MIILVMFITSSPLAIFARNSFADVQDSEIGLFPGFWLIVAGLSGLLIMSLTNRPKI